jgi:hypothetical protein
VIECSICKANNEDKSLYCLECGQRLIPKVPNAQTTANTLPSVNQQINNSGSGRLHSPMLDMGGSPQGVNGGRPNNNISRNGLHSPLLDGQNNLVNLYPNSTEDEEESPRVRPNPISQNHTDKSRLHSPVLDGPISGSFNSAYVEETFSQTVEYESLRSPLLQAKVPLPEKNEAVENSAGQESRLQSLLGSATGPTTNAAPNNPFNITQNNAAKKENFIAPLSVTGINKLSQAVNSANASRSKMGRVGGSNSLLPTEEEILPASQIANTQNKSALNKMLLISLIFLAFGFKVWYLVSLGSAVFGSAPFAFDQAGQIIVLLLMLVLVLS